MRIHTSSEGLDPTALVPGEDLVLALDERHGLDAPQGVLAHDHLDLAARNEVDDAAAAAFRAWRAAHDDALTIDGVCLPFVWEEHVILQGTVTSIRDAAAVDRALDAYGTERIELMDADPHTERAVRAAAARRVGRMGLALGDCVHARVLDVARRRTAGDVARIAVLRRAFARGRVRAVVLAYDLDPDARLVTVVARDAGIPTVVLQHGAVL